MFTRFVRRAHFSTYFKELDNAALKEFGNSYCGSKAYRRAVDLWKKPLEKKALKKERKMANPIQVMDPQDRMIMVHDAEKGVTLPPNPEKVFAVLSVKGTQYRVVKDDRIVLEELGEEFDVGDQLILDEVLMIGTQDYTALGRPQVNGARVYVTLEEKSQSEKVIVFKKKRRQGYQKSQGHKQLLNVVRVDKIEHQLTAQELESGEDVEVIERPSLQGKI